MHKIVNMFQTLWIFAVICIFDIRIILFCFIYLYIRVCNRDVVAFMFGRIVYTESSNMYVFSE